MPSHTRSRAGSVACGGGALDAGGVGGAISMAPPVGTGAASLRAAAAVVETRAVAMSRAGMGVDGVWWRAREGEGWVCESFSRRGA
jgi:hypothetical protein